MCVRAQGFLQQSMLFLTSKLLKDSEAPYERTALSCMRQEDGEKWQDDRGQDAVEVHLVRRERDPED